MDAKNLARASKIQAIIESLEKKLAWLDKAEDHMANSLSDWEEDQEGDMERIGPKKPNPIGDRKTMEANFSAKIMILNSKNHPLVDFGKVSGSELSDFLVGIRKTCSDRISELRREVETL